MSKFKAFEIDADKFWRMYPLISNEETRYYLNGICVQRHPRGASMVATDGHVMGCWLDNMADLPSDHPADGVIVQLPKDALATCKRFARDAEKLGGRAVLRVGADYSATILVWDENGETVASASYSKCVVDGTFPDWRRVIPDHASSDVTAGEQFNSSYIKRFQLGNPKALLSLRIGKPGMPMTIRNADDSDFLGVLMPCRGFDGDKPGWLSEHENQAKPEAA